MESMLKKKILEYQNIIFNFFEKDLPNKVKDCEVRPQQISMSLHVGYNLLTNGFSAIEAKVGTGKTFAYLMPAMLYTSRNLKPIVVATSTLVLQDQIKDKDYPLLEKNFKNIPLYVLKGRTHYLCRRNLEEINPDILPKSQRPVLKNLKRWSTRTNTGERYEFERIYNTSVDFWERIRIPDGGCGECTFREQRICTYFEYRNQIFNLKKGIIVTNHAQLLSDLKNRAKHEKTIFPKNLGGVIVDEAHNLEDAAINILGVHISTSYINSLLNEAAELRKEAKQVLRGLQKMISKYFKMLYKKVKEMDTEATRVPIPNEDINSFSPESLDLNNIIISLEEIQEKYFKESDMGNKIGGLISELKRFESPNEVKWMEIQNRYATIHAVTKNLNKLLGNTFRSINFTHDISFTFTSGTLAERGNFSAFLSTIGIKQNEILTLELSIPFHVKEQSKMFIPSRKQITEPPKGEVKNLCESQFFKQASEFILKLIEITQGKTLILFTSKTHMDEFHRKLKPQLEKYGSVYSQTEGDTVETFKGDENSILFGVGTCWEGIDIKGTSLSQVIIARLPFTPMDPFEENRKSLFDSEQEWFNQYLFPSMALKLKQGIGRLIRDVSDTGIISILDSRVSSRKYGKDVLEILNLDTTSSLTELKQFYRQIQKDKPQVTPQVYSRDKVIKPVDIEVATEENKKERKKKFAGKDWDWLDPEESYLDQDSKPAKQQNKITNKPPVFFIPDPEGNASEEQINYTTKLYKQLANNNEEEIRQAISRQPLWNVYKMAITAKKELKNKGIPCGNFPWRAKGEKEAVKEHYRLKKGVKF